MTLKRRNLFYEILGLMKVLQGHCRNLSISELAEVLLGSWSLRLSSLKLTMASCLLMLGPCSCFHVTDILIFKSNDDTENRKLNECRNNLGPVVQN